MENRCQEKSIRSEHFFVDCGQTFVMQEKQGDELEAYSGASDPGEKTDSE